MLKALELIGFKSFADKTRFEFPPGITVVVGPNGSGKSNIVDGIKWVLGEQSAKSLRGKDMSDVIFKGAGNSGRKPLNTAEATIILDNSDGRFPVDAPEVHVTRRVYRSGEGEYLINREPCRLKDIRDMFRGTGVGTDAYSLIEQGKVDRLLQASPKDRRAIFEEAAGISRFKAKKVEAQRRLARVEQNLVRLSDIVDEVENRLKNVRSQASKARRYREYTERLQQLRTQIGQSDWRRLTEKLLAIENELQQIQDHAMELSAKAESAEARGLELETHLAECAERIHRNENELARNVEQIASRRHSIQQESRRSHDLDLEATRHGRQLSAMTGRAGDIQRRLNATTTSLQDADRQHRQIEQRVVQHQGSLDEVVQQIEMLQSDTEQQRTQYAARIKEAKSLSSQLGALQSQLESLEASIEQSRHQLEELQPLVAKQTSEMVSLKDQIGTLVIQVEQRESEVESVLAELKSDRRLVQRRQDELVDLQGHLSGCKKRADVLEQLEREREGLSDGVKDILQRSQQPAAGVLVDVCGVVADLIHADVQIAPLVDVALGELSKRVVVRGARIADRLRHRDLRLEDRVSFVRADTPAARRETDRVRLDGLQGVLGRADRLVQCAPEFNTLFHKLLGDVWFVDSLGDAFRYQQMGGRGVRFVTAQGEMLEPDGSIVAGPMLGTGGLVSRKSELQAVRQEIEVFQQRTDSSAAEVRRVRENIERKERKADTLGDQVQDARSRLVQAQTRAETLQQGLDRIRSQTKALELELKSALERRGTATGNLDATQANLEQVDAVGKQLDQQLRDKQRDLQHAERESQRQRGLVTEAKVALAKSEQQVDSLRARMLQFEEDQRERTRVIDETRSQLLDAERRRKASELESLCYGAELAEAYLRKEEIAVEIRWWSDKQEETIQARTDVAREVQRLRRSLKKEEDGRHKKELEAGEVRHDRNAMAQRLREDYGIEISQLDQAQSEADLQKRESADDEIQSLRRKISNIGAVNMEALGELDDLETRFNSLSAQFQDLTNAKDSLERIIHKINADSRRLFVETLEAIRANFQVLYRKSFGGGKADIVLDANEDVLEAGIEIIATPPGKPSFNNSLLSGGEKALTAVSLLLAIFQYRPSPFCVLDEVDAPFDEANIGRFVDVLREFLGWTKFVIVTHSKKTMTAATTLYGVTMQESGVSKRVSVRFEDVSDDGHISQAAIERDAEQESDDERGAA